MKLCQDCRHIERDEEDAIVKRGRCMHPALKKTFIDYVTGENHTVNPDCQLARTIMRECGQDALLWESR